MKIIIQGYLGSFHDEVSHLYFSDEVVETICADSFQILGQQFAEDKSIEYAVMAIENSIAGTILQNYKIIREQRFYIIGEAYLRIRMNLMALHGTKLEDIKAIHSHPMALYQCGIFLRQHHSVKLVESEDTALSAKLIAEHQHRRRAAIASRRAADIYNLELLAEGIEDNKANYTRFFVLGRHLLQSPQCDKASIWCRISHSRGSLVQMLSIIANHGINLSKLQSYPVLGKFSEYSFHMDLEFEQLHQYLKLKEVLKKEVLQYQELGIYKKADISAAVANEDTDIML